MSSENMCSLTMVSKAYPKKSFMRFGDDLCELVLSYLTLEDKFAFECVSKQWKRLIFNKHYELVIDDSLTKTWTKVDIRGNKRIELWPFIARVLRKLRCIRSAKIDVYIKERDIITKNAIIKYSKSWTSIECNDYTLTQIFGNDIEGVGLQLKKLKINGKAVDVFPVIQLCPKLVDIDVKTFSVIFDDMNEPLFKKLKRFSVEYKSEDSERFESLVKTNKKSLKSLSLNIHKKCNELALNQMRRQLKDLIVLNDLTIAFTKRVSIQWLRELIQQIGSHCSQLKRFCLVAKCSQLSDKLLILDEINRHLSRVKRLNLNLFDFTPNELFEKDLEISIKSLNSCQYLTHLTLDLGNYPIGDHFFNNIDHYLPNLQSICISFANISDSAINSLSYLPNIRFIEIQVFDETAIGRRSFRRIERKCPKIIETVIKSV